MAATALLLCATLSGCAAWTNPVAHGIPVEAVPPGLLACPKLGRQTIPLSYLRQEPPEVYLLGPGDVLGVYIEGVLGEKGQAPPVNVSERANIPPSIGYPIPIREDGTVPLPFVPPIKVSGMTLPQAERAIIDTFTVKTNVLQAGRERILVTLIYPRQTRVLVIRQDTPSGGLPATRGTPLTRTRGLLGGAEFLIGGARQGTGTVLALPAYENDVLHALAETGGLPGLDAQNEVIVQRGSAARWRDPKLTPPLSADGRAPARDIVRIPLRICPGEPPPFRPEDVILQPGDIVFIEARETEVYYTGGLLPAGEWPLPRDYDLDVVEAISRVGGPLVNGGFNSSNLSGSLIAPGIGAPSPRLVTVLRRTPDGGQCPIIVDLFAALKDARQNLLLKPGDVLIMQETKSQALARYFSQVFQFSLISNVIQTSRTTATTSVVVP